MADKGVVLAQLVEMSNLLGAPEMDCTILGEGNTSAKADEKSFFIKASGTQLSDITEAGFVEIAFDRANEILNHDRLTDEEITRLMMAAKADPEDPRRPSVEVGFHAALLSFEGVRFVGHTHPAAVNAILCSKRWREALSGRLFPDEIVCCGIEPVLVPYVDPGPPLAKAIRKGVEDFIDRHGAIPKTVMMQNHGLIALGATPKQVQSITMMAIKTARILAGTYLFGGPNFFTPENVDRIYTRPDEKYREKNIEGK
ncbi:MAG: class II aldolase/adducin family protein [Armatimonadetes bacterium]|nr:class II aldolase/adducin family protein [Armatimonadota bacterium]